MLQYVHTLQYILYYTALYYTLHTTPYYTLHYTILHTTLYYVHTALHKFSTPCESEQFQQHQPTFRKSLQFHFQIITSTH